MISDNHERQLLFCMFEKSASFLFCRADIAENCQRTRPLGTENSWWEMLTF